MMLHRMKQPAAALVMLSTRKRRFQPPLPLMVCWQVAPRSHPGDFPEDAARSRDPLRVSRAAWRLHLACGAVDPHASDHEPGCFSGLEPSRRPNCS